MNAGSRETRGGESPAEGWLALAAEAIRGSERDFARLSLKTAIPLLAIPMVLESGMEAIFAVVDVFFVSRLGPDAVAAVGLTESLITIVYAVGIGFAMAVTATVSRRWGEDDRPAASQAAGQAVLLAVALGLGLGIPAASAAPELLALMGAESGVLEIGTGYAVVMLGSNVIIMLLFILGAVFRGAGDATHPMRALWLANGLNLVLDPCLIFGLGPFPELGVTGAAVATAIGRSIGVAYLGWSLVGRSRIRLTARALRPVWAVIANLIRVSLGGIGQFLVSTASSIALVRLLAAFGSEVVAGYTISIRVTIFALLPSWGFATATSTLVGQSLGAGDPDRAERAVLYSGLYNTAFLGLISVLFIAVPHPIAGIFTNDPVVAGYAADALRIIAYGYVFYAWEMVLANSFNGAGDTRTPTLINIVAFWLVEIPLAWWLAHGAGWGPHGVFAAVAFAYSFAAVIAYAAFRRGTWKHAKV